LSEHVGEGKLQTPSSGNTSWSPTDACALHDEDVIFCWCGNENYTFPGCTALLVNLWTATWWLPHSFPSHLLCLMFAISKCTNRFSFGTAWWRLCPTHRPYNKPIFYISYYAIGDNLFLLRICP